MGIHLTETEQKMTKNELREKINLFEKEDTDESRLMVKYYSLILRYKVVQERKELENQVKKKLKQKMVSGSYQPEQVAKVLGITTRQAMTIEKRALAKLKSPDFGRKLRNLKFE